MKFVEPITIYIFIYIYLCYITISYHETPGGLVVQSVSARLCACYLFHPEKRASFWGQMRNLQLSWSYSTTCVSKSLTNSMTWFHVSWSTYDSPKRASGNPIQGMSPHPPWWDKSRWTAKTQSFLCFIMSYLVCQSTNTLRKSQCKTSAMRMKNSMKYPWIANDCQSVI